MSIRPFKLEVDNTGVNPNNLIVNEPHKLQATGKRFIVTDNGPFYTKSLRIVDMATGEPLAPRTQFTAIQLEEEATLESGKEVCSIIVIDDDKVSENVTVTYQAYGGWMSWSVTAIREMIEALDLDNRPIIWGQIVGKPDRYPPAPHAHPLSDIYGWHKLFPALNAIRDAILVSDQAVFDAIRAAFQLEIDKLVAKDNAIEAAANLHYNNFNNPHNVTIHQIDGLSSAEIYALLATKLGKTETAVNSMKLEGRSFLQTRNEIVGSIQNSELINGLMKKANLGENFVGTDRSLVLTTDGWRKFKTHETEYGRNITELDGYTTAEVNSLLATKLGKTETAVNSAKLEDRTFAQTRAEIVGSINNAELVRGRFPMNNMGSGFNASNLALILTAGGWKTFKSMQDAYGSQGGGALWAGAMTVGQIQAAYADMTAYPIGTLVGFSRSWNETVGTGNGATTVTRYDRGLLLKISVGGWARVSAF